MINPGDTIIIETTISSKQPFVYPALSNASPITVTIVDPTEVPLVTAAPMTNYATGLYYYNYSLSGSAKAGTYKAQITAQVGGSQGVEETKFEVVAL